MLSLTSMRCSIVPVYCRALLKDFPDALRREVSVYVYANVIASSDVLQILDQVDKQVVPHLVAEFQPVVVWCMIVGWLGHGSRSSSCTLNYPTYRSLPYDDVQLYAVLAQRIYRPLRRPGGSLVRDRLWAGGLRVPPGCGCGLHQIRSGRLLWRGMRTK